MARHYYLLMAFSDHEATMAAERSFAQLQLTLADLGQLACVTTISPMNEGNWTVWVHPTGVSLGVAGDPPRLTSTDQLDEIAQQLYQQLRQFEGYMCAVAGWEVAEMFIMEVHGTYRDLQFDPEIFAGIRWDGLVLQETLWTGMGAPVEFESFRPGYVWRPYQTLGISGW